MDRKPLGYDNGCRAKVECEMDSVACTKGLALPLSADDCSCPCHQEARLSGSGVELVVCESVRELS